MCARTNWSGVPPRDAVRRAVRERFRPIVLTTLTAVLGMLPTALGFGTGAAPEQGLAIVVLGGVAWSSVLSTNLLPALYLRWGGGHEAPRRLLRSPAAKRLRRVSAVAARYPGDGARRCRERHDRRRGDGVRAAPSCVRPCPRPRHDGRRHARGDQRSAVEGRTRRTRHRRGAGVRRRPVARSGTGCLACVSDERSGRSDRVRPWACIRHQ